MASVRKAAASWRSDACMVSVAFRAACGWYRSGVCPSAAANAGSPLYHSGGISKFLEVFPPVFGEPKNEDFRAGLHGAADQDRHELQWECLRRPASEDRDELLANRYVDGHEGLRDKCPSTPREALNSQNFCERFIRTGDGLTFDPLPLPRYPNHCCRGA